MRRLVLLIPLVVVVLAFGLLALGPCDAVGADRVVRAADAMEHLRGVQFSLNASSVASGSRSLAGISSWPTRPRASWRPRTGCGSW